MASTKVRGITIELGADTTGLSKGLTQINKEIGSTQKQLKDVNRLLKLDPGNADLMAQKQRLLNDRIGETRTKLDALKEAQKEVGDELKKTGEGQEQYDALQREIIACENELKNLQKEAIASSDAMQKIAQAGEGLKKAGDNVQNLGRSLMPLSAAAAGAAAGIVKTTADFDASMSKVAAVSGAAGDDFDALREKAREMGATTKFTASEAAEAMNYMAMAGWKTEQMLDGVSGVMSLAAASGEDLATTSDIVTDALTAFGMKAEDSSRFADILAAAASNANTNVAMMGESFKYAAPVAGSLGYSAEDVSIALGLMANSGIKASMAGTSLRNIFQRMAKPTKESAMAMDRLGLALDDGQGNMYSFRQIMDQLRKGFVEINMPIEEYDRQVEILDEALADGSIKEKTYMKELEELNKQAFGAAGAEKARAAAMLGGSRAMSGLLAIANASEEDYNKLTQAIDNSSQAFARTKDGVVPLNEALASGAEILETYEGAAASMAATMQDNASGQMEILKSQLQELAISLGDTLMPTLRQLIGYVQGVVDKLNGMDESTKTMIMNAILLAAALGPVLIIVGKLMSATGSLMTTFPKIVAALGGLTAPLIAAVAAVGLLVAAFVHLMETNEQFRTTVTGIWDDVQGRFAAFGQHITDTLNQMGGDFQNFSEVVRATWDGLCNFLAPFMETTMKFVQSVIDHALRAIEGLFDIFAGVFTGNWSQVWNGVKEVFTGVWGVLLDVARNTLNSILGLMNGVIDGINAVASAGGKGQVISRIPLLANGGILSSGSAIVGEAGAELLTMVDGKAVVQPLNNNTNNYAGATNNFYIQSSDPEQVAEEVSTILNNQMQRMQGAWA